MNKLTEQANILVEKVEEAIKELQELRKHLDDMLSFGGAE
jgi:hypothetical protein